MSNPLVNKKVVNIREEQLTLGRLLGEGNFGQVFAGEYRDEHGAAVCLFLLSMSLLSLFDSFL